MGSSKILKWYEGLIVTKMALIAAAETTIISFKPIRAPAADVLNVPNVKFLARLAHQTQK